MKSDLNGRSGRNQRVALCRKPPPQIRPEGDRIAQNWIRHQSLTSNDRFDSMGFCHLPPYYNTKDGSSPAESVYQSRPQRPAFLGRLVPSACIFADETRPTTSNLRCIHLAKICIPEGVTKFQLGPVYHVELLPCGVGYQPLFGSQPLCFPVAATQNPCRSALRAERKISQLPQSIYVGPEDCLPLLGWSRLGFCGRRLLTTRLLWRRRRGLARLRLGSRGMSNRRLWSRSMLNACWGRGLLRLRLGSRGMSNRGLWSRSMLNTCWGRFDFLLWRRGLMGLRLDGGGE